MRQVVREESAAGKSLAQIAEALTAKGISTPRHGAAWAKPSVQNVVQWMQDNGELPSDNAA